MRSNRLLALNSFLVGRQVGLIRVDNEHGKQASTLRLAGIFTDAVMIARKLRKAFAGTIGFYRPVIDLASNRSLKNRGVDEGGVRMSMSRRRTTRLIFDEHDFHALAGHVRQRLIVDELDGVVVGRYPVTEAATSAIAARNVLIM